ncbi:YchJ family protein [Lysinibacter cavernae]|nr:YchJ family protein [Lysinibacter cavernae]
MIDSERCPCLSGETYGACCGPMHAGAKTAPTAERLMRSRYSAFLAGDAAYLLKTWHPATRPEELVMEDGLRWLRLDILDTVGGSLFETEGVVEFRALYSSIPEDGEPAERGMLHERSRFIKLDGEWVYMDGEIRS